MKILANQRGQSLIQLMISMAISGVVMMALITVTSTEAKQSAAMQQKLAALDLQRTLTAALQDGSICSYIVATTSVPAFDPLTFSAPGEHLFMRMSSIPSSVTPGAIPLVVADNQTAVSPIDDSVTAQSIAIDDVQCNPRPCTGDTTDYTANITVTLTSQSLLSPLQPLKFPVTLKSTGTTGKQVMGACRGQSVLETKTSSSSTETCGGGRPACIADSVPSQSTCPDGYQVTGCGWALSTWAPRPNDNSDPNSDLHTNAPNYVIKDGNGCKIYAGEAPGCGICFKAQAFCIKLR